MKTGKYMDDYNYHDWTSFMVREPKDKPKGPHFAAILFESKTEWTPAYDRDDRDTSQEVTVLNYFAFPDKETLKEWTLRASKEKKQFFFFEVKKMGSVELKVDVDLGV